MSDVATAIQFLSVCATDPVTHKNRPRGEGVSVIQVLRYLLESEAKVLAQDNFNAGT